MGLFSKLKNSLTGGWAEVKVMIPEGGVERGASLPVTIEVQVKDETIDVSKIYSKFCCEEVVDIPNFRSRDEDNRNDIDYVHVNVKSDLLDEEFVIEEGLTLESNQTYTYDGNLSVPEDLPPSFTGRHATVEWSVYAGLDMRGNDPDSGWVEVEEY